MNPRVWKIAALVSLALLTTTFAALLMLLARPKPAHEEARAPVAAQAAPAPFSPPAVSSGTLRVCLSADSLGLADGTPVGTWPGLNGTPTATQATPANQPVYLAAGLNGASPAVVFDGSASYLSLGHALDDLILGQGATPTQLGTPTMRYTVLAVLQQRSNASQHWVCGKWNYTTPPPPAASDTGSGRGPRLSLAAYPNTAGNRIICVSDKSDGSQTDAVWGTTNLGTAPHVVTATFDATVIDNPSKITLYLDSVQEGRQTLGDPSHSFNGSADNAAAEFLIGASVNDGKLTSVFDGSISALMVYAGVLTAADRLAVEEALGLTYGLPGYAPYIFAAGSKVQVDGTTVADRLPSAVMVRRGAPLTADQQQAVQGLLR